MVFNMYSPDLQFSLAVLQLKAAISDSRTRAAETLKRRRDEQGVDYYSRRSQGADWKLVVLYGILFTIIQCYITCGGAV